MTVEIDKFNFGIYPERKNSHILANERDHF
jgi:hypothetical protein